MPETQGVPVSLQAAFAAFYRSRYGSVLAFVTRRVDDQETAREITADVFQVAWRAFVPEAEPESSWLLTVARNRIGDAYRRQDRERRLVHALQTEALRLRHPVVDDERVANTLALLPPAHQEVLALTYWDGLTAAEAATVMGTTSGAVWVRLHRARRAFLAAWTRTGA